MRAEVRPGQAGYDDIWSLYQTWLANRSKSDYRTHCNAITKRIKDMGYTLPLTLAAFSPDWTATKEWAKGAYDAFWTSPGALLSPHPKNPSADKVFQAYHYEKDRCGYTAGNMARKVMHFRRAGLKASMGNLYTDRIGNAKPKGGGTRDILGYDPTQLGKDVGKVMASIEAGYLYSFGVLSGVKFDGGVKWPRPEHYILGFASHSNAILFWDPDAGVTNIASRPWGAGFGVIYHSDDRLSTAYNQSDFDNVALATNEQTGERFGDHNQSKSRHLYQVFKATPLP